VSVWITIARERRCRSRIRDALLAPPRIHRYKRPAPSTDAKSTHLCHASQRAARACCVASLSARTARAQLGSQHGGECWPCRGPLGVIAVSLDERGQDNGGLRSCFGRSEDAGIAVGQRASGAGPLSPPACVCVLALRSLLEPQPLRTPRAHREPQHMPSLPQAASRDRLMLDLNQRTTTCPVPQLVEAAPAKVGTTGDQARPLRCLPQGPHASPARSPAAARMRGHARM
jgi:hypothetical protein